MKHNSEKIEESIERTAETIGDTIVTIIDKLAGKRSDIKLSFEDLSLEAGPLKAHMNGAIVLDIVMAKEYENQTGKATGSATYYPTT
jgi:hypothetical protein